MPEERVDLEDYKRRWQRLYVNLPVRILVRSPHCFRIFTGRGAELNEGGMAVHVGVELGIGDHVGIELPAPDSSPPLRLAAVVRNRKGYLYGLRFQPASAQTLW
jgi:hypothetical protein